MELIKWALKEATIPSIVKEARQVDSTNRMQFSLKTNWLTAFVDSSIQKSGSKKEKE